MPSIGPTKNKMTLKTVMRTKIDLIDTPNNEKDNQRSSKKKPNSQTEVMNIQPFSLVPSQSEQAFRSL